jgi:LmbE family N-acetylglucosaminyl deacetylase
MVIMRSRPFFSRHHLPALVVLVLAALWLILPAQPLAEGITDARGEVGLALMLRKLASVGTVMHITAHPDDENNGLMAMQSHGDGLRVVLATATRGNGGQNEIGPELFEALGVLRTEELLAAHHYDGAEQFFARAVDFGYSFSVEETLEKWGKEEIVGDYVHLMRLTRPDVVITMRPDGAGGGQHHQTSARIGLEAFHEAGDSTKYPEQITEGLRPWRPLKIYESRFYGFFRGDQTPPPDMKLVAADANVYDPLLGKTYAEIGSEARAMHKCQGFGQLLALPGPFLVKYRLVGTVIEGEKDRDESTLFDGVDTTLRGLAHFAGARPPAALLQGLADIDSAVRTADQRLRAAGPDGAVAPLAAGLTAARTLRERLSTIGLDETALYEIDFRLTQEIHKFERALVLAQGLRLEALADDGVVTPGESLKVTLIEANRGRAAMTAGVPSVEGLDGPPPACADGSVPSGGIVQCDAQVSVPAAAAVSEPYWTRNGEAGRYVFDKDAPFGLPFRPTPFRAHFDLTIGGVAVPVDLPIAYRYEGNIFSGEKRSQLLVVPDVTVNVTPGIAIVPTAAGPVPTATSTNDRARQVQVVVTHNAPGSADVDVSLAVPAGWALDPARKTVTFDGPDQQAVVRFVVEPPASLVPGTYPIAARVTSEGRSWHRGFDVIEYPHIHRRHIYSEASLTIKALDVKLPAGLHVGYVMGVGDQVPPAIEQLGASVHMLSEQDLATGDLDRYDVIVTGVRAYERRTDLRAYNHRLLEYAEHGGTVIVQYNKFEFNQAQYGPYPVKVSSNRVTDQDAPVTILVPDHPVFNRPNRITDEAWAHWVQERGLYFLGERDPRYVDLVELSDPFPFNAGPKRGALVEARVGSGRWVYVGLNLWRQLPAGTEGAYELLANLLSLGSTERAAARR